MADGVDDELFYARRGLPAGREAVVFPILYGRARLAVGPAGCMGYDDVW